MAKRMRVAIIGHTGRGGYGHDLDHKWVRAHHRMARSMVAMLRGEQPDYALVQGENARLYLEMAMMAHASHMSGARVSLPLPDGSNPFDAWR